MGGDARHLPGRKARGQPRRKQRFGLTDALRGGQHTAGRRTAQRDRQSERTCSANAAEVLAVGTRPSGDAETTPGGQPGGGMSGRLEVFVRADHRKGDVADVHALQPARDVARGRTLSFSPRGEQ